MTLDEPMHDSESKNKPGYKVHRLALLGVSAGTWPPIRRLTCSMPVILPINE